MPNEIPNPYEPSDSNSDSNDELILPRLTNEKLFVLATFDNHIDARLLQNELATHGIPSRTANETSAPVLGLTIAGQSSAFWIEVLVLESMAEKSLKIKGDWLDNKNDQKLVIPEWVCGCGETVDAGFAICWSCNADYKNG